jgi:anthranilate synthase component 1
MTMPAPRRAAEVCSLPYDFDPLALCRLAPQRYPFLLESVARNPAQGRYDILFAFPQETIRADSETVPFLERLDHSWTQAALPPASSPPPFAGGWFLCLTYELAGEIEQTLQLAPWSGGFTAFATRIPVALIRDHRARRAWASAEPGHEAYLPALQRDLKAAANLDEPELAGPVQLDPAPVEPYLEAVRRAQQHIAAGDIFQANLSRVWRAGPAPVDLAPIYAALRRCNPAPFAGLVRWPHGGLASSSPERLIGIRGGRVFTRPIAGTRPRAATAAVDSALSRELFASAKERAEHVMLIDLERNDLGRICAAGSVQVDEFMVRESYAHVHHIVSNVSGELRQDVTPGQAIAAVFPGGTITGVPKVRCMELIAALEDGPRGPYTGSIGYLDRDGSMDLNILIRSLVQDSSGISLRAGAGIVADSQPAEELAETQAKAKGLLLALDVG